MSDLPTTEIAISPRSPAIFASAGTGKTYRLTSHYLGLLAREVPPERVLAVTFTRQAAREILDRVTSRLLEAAQSTERRADLSRSLGLASPLLHGQCVSMLAALFRRADRVRISTLDSFFSRLATSFEDHVGLPTGWRILSDDEDAQLRETALEAVVEQSEPRETLELLRMLARDSSQAAVYQPVLDALAECHHMRTLTDASAWTWQPAMKEPLRNEAELAAAIADWRDCPAAILTTSTTWSQSHTKSLEFISRHDWESFLERGPAEKLLNDHTDYNRQRIPSEVRAALNPLIRHAVAVLLNRHRNSTLAAKSLAERFDVSYRALKHTVRGARFDDMPRALLEAGVTGDLDTLYYRLDGELDHLLLDEFQDTSVVQFRLVEPVIAELLSGGEGRLDTSRTESAFAAGRTVLCVGDVKQSLYGWRDAEPKLLPATANKWPQLTRETLDVSYRSSSVVLDAVNQVFANTALRENRLIASARLTAAAASEWAANCPAHRPAKSLPGRVSLRLVRRPKDDPDAVLREACERVRVLRAECEHASIGILVRTKKHIRPIIDSLRRLGIAASEESGCALTDTPAINAAVAALHLIDHPSDTAARFHVAISPLGELLQLLDWREDSLYGRFAHATREEACREGTAAMLGRWMRGLSDQLTPSEGSRFEQLIALAREWDAQYPGATVFHPLVRRIATKRIEAPGGSTVRIMTIHASKGLEFDAVILPDLGFRLADSRARFILHRESPLDEKTVVARTPNKTLQACLPELRTLAESHLNDAIQESLSILYVAMTRARRALEMLVEPLSTAAMDADSDRVPTASEVLISAFDMIDQATPTDPPSAAETTVLFEKADGNWSRGVQPFTTDLTGSGPLLAPLNLRPARADSIRMRSRRSPSRTAGAEEEPFAPGAGSTESTFGDVFSVDPDDPHEPDLPPTFEAPSLLTARSSLSRGTLFHAWFELIEWLDGHTIPKEDALRAAAIRHAPDTLHEFATHVRAFRSALAVPALAQWLRRDTLANRWPTMLEATAYRELSVAVPLDGAHGEPELISGQIDRVTIVFDKSDRPIGAEILDFKTDSLPPGGEATMRSRYSGQLGIYRRCVARLWKLREESISCRLLMIGAGKMIEVP
jgi:ATP-dependent helicase/nuclease subunit A